MNMPKLFAFASMTVLLLHIPEFSRGQEPPAATDTVTIEGTVERVWFRNPNVRYLIAVPKAAERDDEVWDVRASSVEWLAQRGWTSDTIRVGDTVTIHGQRRRAGKRSLSVLSVTLSDGTLLVDRAPD